MAEEEEEGASEEEGEAWAFGPAASAESAVAAALALERWAAQWAAAEPCLAEQLAPRALSVAHAGSFIASMSL